MTKNTLQAYLTEQQRELNRALAPLKDANLLTPPGASLVGTFLQIPALRGYWPMTTRDESGNLLDLSGQGRTLTNNSAAAFGLSGVVSYGIGDGSADYFSRADEAGLSITGALSWGGWFYSDDAPAGIETFIGKWNTGLNNRAFVLRMTSTPDYRALVSSNGTAETSVTSSVAYTAASWKFVVGVYVPSTSLKIYINSGGLMTATTNTTSIPASLADTAAAFTIQANGTPGEYLDGRSSNCFVSAYSLTAGWVQWLFDQTRWAYYV